MAYRWHSVVTKIISSNVQSSSCQYAPAETLISWPLWPLLSLLWSVWPSIDSPICLCLKPRVFTVWLDGRYCWIHRGWKYIKIIFYWKPMICLLIEWLSLLNNRRAKLQIKLINNSQTMLQIVEIVKLIHFCWVKFYIVTFLVNGSSLHKRYLDAFFSTLAVLSCHFLNR